MNPGAAVFRARDGVISTWLGDEGGVVVDLSRRRYHSLNASAMAVFEAVADPRNAAQVADMLRVRFDPGSADVGAAAARALARLLDEGLVEEVQP